MREKPEVLVVAGYYRPGFKAGGPIASVENLVRALGDEFDFRVLALDHDLGETARYPGEKRREEAVYVSESAAWKTLRREIKSARGVIYLQSLFDPVWGLMPVLSAPRGRLLIAPRGQLGPGAMAYGGRKKRVILGLLRSANLGDLAYWQATADSDVADIRRSAPWIAPDHVLVAPNLPSDPGFSPRLKPAGRLRAVYVGRIDPKKNLLTAVRSAVAAGIELDVVGPAEDAAYAEECRRAANDQIRFLGPMPPEEVERHLRAADAFLFPTFGENYGHSIVEAMLSGLPAVIGDTTPWRDLEKTRGGFDLPPNDVDQIANALRKLANLPEEEYVRWSEGARATIEAATEREAAVEASRRMLLKVYENSRG